MKHIYTQSIKKSKSIKIGFLILIILASIIIPAAAKAQCTPPARADITTSPSSCTNSGAITVANVYDASNNVLNLTAFKYGLVNTTTGDTVQYLGNSPSMTSLAPGNYKVIVMGLTATCGVVPPSLTVPVTITGDYSKPEIHKQPAYTVASIICSDGTTDLAKGSFTVIGSEGTGSYKFAIVSNITDAEPISSYIRAPQTSGTFNNLPAGTYAVRIYDAGCPGTNYSTDTVILTSYKLRPDPLTVGVNFQSCSTVTLNASLNPLVEGYTFLPSPYPSDTVFVQWGNGRKDTLAITDVYNNVISGGNIITRNVADVSTAYPVTYTATYTDICGKKHVVSGQLNNPGTYSFRQNSDPSLGNTMTTYGPLRSINCDSVAIPNRPVIIDANNNVYSNNLISCYSLDSGKTWIPFTEDAQLAFEKGSTIKILYQFCSCTGTASTAVPFTLVVPGSTSAGGKTDLHLDMGEYNAMACEGRSGIEISPSSSHSSFNGNVANIIAIMRAAPAAYGTSPADTMLNRPFLLGVRGTQAYGSLSTALYPWLINLPAGTYTFEFIDECGKDVQQSVTISNPVNNESATFTPVIACKPENSYIQANYTGPSDILVAVFFHIYVKQADGSWKDSTIVHGGDWFSPVPDKLLVGAPKGTYKIVTYRYGNMGPDTDTDPYYFYSNGEPGSASGPVWDDIMDGDEVKGYGGCQLVSIIDFDPEKKPLKVATKFTSNCGTSQMSVVAQAIDGVAPYSYSVFTNNNGALGTLIEGPKPTPTFNSLSQGAPYLLYLSDACGSGTTASVTNAPYTPVYAENSYSPCRGQDVVISVRKDATLNYTWYYTDATTNVPTAISDGFKSGQHIMGDTTLEIDNVDYSVNGGKYSLQITMPGLTCPVYSRDIYVTDSMCNILPLRITSFNGTKTSAGNYLKWTTADEVNTRSFSIEYGKTSQSLTAIGTVPALGNANTANYSYLHTGVQGDAYYRLKMTDIDGKTYYSSVIYIKGDNSSSATGFDLLKASPVPFTSYVKIDYTAGSDMNTQVQIFNQLGQTLYTNGTQLKKGNNVLQITGLQNLPSGIYILRIQNAQGVYKNMKIMKQ